MRNLDTNDHFHWKNLIKGEQESLKYLYEAYINDLYSYGLKFLNHEDKVKDAIHDLFIDLYTYRSKLASEVNVKHYLLFSLKRKIINNHRSFSRLEFGTHFNLTVVDTQSSHEDHYIHHEAELSLLGKIKVELAQLPSRQKEALYLKYVQDLDYTEIANLMGISIATCRTLIYRSIKQLRGSLSHEAQISGEAGIGAALGMEVF